MNLTEELIRSCNEFALKLMRIVPEHANPELIHSACLLSFLEAGLGKSGLWDKYLDRVNRIKRSLISSQALRSFINGELSGRALNVLFKLDKLKENPEFSWVDLSPSIAHMRQQLSRRISTINRILILDGLSLVEHLALQVFALKRSAEAQLMDCVGYNPSGVTKFISRQFEEESLRGFMNKVGDALIVPPNSRELSYDFGNMLHGSGNLEDKLPGIQAEFKKVCWKLAEILDRSKPWEDKILISSDHGYGIWGYRGDLFLEHGIHGASGEFGCRILGLDEFIFFQVMTSL